MSSVLPTRRTDIENFLKEYAPAYILGPLPDSAEFLQLPAIERAARLCIECRVTQRQAMTYAGLGPKNRGKITRAVRALRSVPSRII